MLKGADRDELTRAIVSVASGGVVFGPGVARRVIDLFNAPAPPPSAPSPPFPQLTDREREVLDLLARGQSNHTIGRELFLSPRTVANYVSSILSKLHAADRTEIAIRAREAGLGSTDA